MKGKFLATVTVRTPRLHLSLTLSPVTTVWPGLSFIMLIELLSVLTFMPYFLIHCGYREHGRYKLDTMYISLSFCAFL